MFTQPHFYSSLRPLFCCKSKCSQEIVHVITHLLPPSPPTHGAPYHLGDHEGLLVVDIINDFVLVYLLLLLLLFLILLIRKASLKLLLLSIPSPYYFSSMKAS